MSRNRTIAVLLLMIPFAAVVVGCGGGVNSAQPVVGESAVATRLSGIAQAGEYLGRRDAPILITEFVDMQCPACGDLSRTGMTRVINALVRPGIARIRRRVVVATMPREPSAQAALLARAAGMQNRLWSFTEMWFENLPVVSGQDVRVVAPAIAARAGIDAERVNRALSHRDDLVLDADVARATMNRLGVTHLPAVLIEAKRHRAKLLEAPDVATVIEQARKMLR